MKTVLKSNASLLLLTFALLFGYGSMYAQGPQRGQQGPPPLPNDEQIEKMVSDLSEDLSLTDTQEKQVSDLYFAHFEEVSALVGDDNSKKPDRQVMEKVKKTFEAEVKSLLTADQQKKYDAFLKENAPKRRGQEKPNN